MDPICLAFTKDKTRNPVTGRLIKENGPTYRELERRCARQTNVNTHSVKAHVEPIVKAHVEPIVKAQPKVNVNTQPIVKAHVEPIVKAQPKVNVNTQPSVKTQPKVNVNTQPSVKTQPSVNTQPSVKTQPKVNVNTQPSVNTQPKVKTQHNRRKTDTNHNVPPRPCFAFFIVGLGCSLSEGDEFEMFEKEMTRTTGMQMKIMCNKSLSKTLFHIAKSVCNMPPSSKNEFVITCINAVQEKMNDGYNVFVVGHSYGGAVANRIAQHFRAHTEPNLHIATMGSIYISKPEIVGSVDIHNYMHIHDVALKCTNCKINDTKSCKVTWLKDQGAERKKPKRSLLGTRQEWENHNNYYPLIMSIFLNKSVHLGNYDMGTLERVLK
jgi:hypothetical protein